MNKVVDTRRKQGVATLMLAAGQSTRMAPKNKLLTRLAARQSLIRISLGHLLASQVGLICLVTGYQAQAVAAELAGLEDQRLHLLHNAHYQSGMATSLACGIAKLKEFEAEGAALDGALVVLADMPFVSAADIDHLLGVFASHKHPPILVPCYGGQRGNPVLWPRRFFDEIQLLSGDRGAKSLLQIHADQVLEVAMASAAVLRDIDNPESLAQARVDFSS